MAAILAKAVISNDLFAQAFPEFGPERRGAPVKAYARFSYEPILARNSINKPDIVVVMSENLLSLDDVLGGITTSTIMVINTKLEEKELKIKYALIPEYRLLHCIDLEEKNTEWQGKVHPSIPVLGEIVKLTEVTSLEKLKLALREEFMEKIGEKNMKITEKALEDAYYNF